jgi:hypothetical protein
VQSFPYSSDPNTVEFEEVLIVENILLAKRVTPGDI